MKLKELNLEVVTLDELQEVEDYQLLDEDDIVNRCHDYLDEHIQYLPQHYFDMFLDEEVIKSYFLEFYDGYISDIKSEEGRLTEEMAEWNCKDEDDFLEKLVDDAISEKVEYFIFNFGKEDGISFLLSFNAINVEGLKDYILDTDSFEEILGLEVKEVKVGNNNYFLLEN